MFPNISLDDENFTNGQSRKKVGVTTAGFHRGKTAALGHQWFLMEGNTDFTGQPEKQ